MDMDKERVAASSAAWGWFFWYRPSPKPPALRLPPNCRQIIRKFIVIDDYKFILMMAAQSSGVGGLKVIRSVVPF